jgi:hypothetical protein
MGETRTCYLCLTSLKIDITILIILFLIDMVIFARTILPQKF